MKKILKICFIIIVIVAVLIVAWQLSLFVRVKNIEKKTFENFKGDYYYKVTSNSGVTKEYWVNDDYSVINLNKTGTMWYDGDKKVFTTVVNGGDSAFLQYNRDGETPFGIVDIFSKGYTPYITYWTWDGVIGYLKYDEVTLLTRIKNVFYELVEKPLLTIKNVTTETINGKECYKVDLNGFMTLRDTYYIEKETSLLIRTIERNGEQIYMEDYEYSFEPIDNESLKMPNLDECYVIVQDN